MKNLIAVLAVAALVLTGCKSPVGQVVLPAVTQTAVFFGVSAVLQKNHNLVPAAKAGADIICAVAAGTNANPTAMVAALDAAGPWTFEEWALLNGVVVIAVEIGANSANGPAQPYIQAGCNGLGMAIAAAPADAPTVRTPPVASPMLRMRTAAAKPGDPKWPQMK